MLTGANLVWLKFGLVLHSIVSPIVLGVIFLGLLTPVALLMRLFGRDALTLGFDPALPSYWKERGRPLIEPESFPRQF